MSEPHPAGSPFVTQVRVRYAETDAEGVVYYGSYLTYFEVARVELLRALGCPVSDVRARGIVFPAVEVTCRYHQPGQGRRPAGRAVVAPAQAASVAGLRVRGALRRPAAGQRFVAARVRGRDHGRALPLPAWFTKLYDEAAHMVGTAR